MNNFIRKKNANLARNFVKSTGAILTLVGIILALAISISLIGNHSTDTLAGNLIFFAVSLIVAFGGVTLFRYPTGKEK